MEADAFVDAFDRSGRSADSRLPEASHVVVQRDGAVTGSTNSPRSLSVLALRSAPRVGQAFTGPGAPGRIRNDDRLGGQRPTPTPTNGAGKCDTSSRHSKRPLVTNRDRFTGKASQNRNR